MIRETNRVGHGDTLEARRRGRAAPLLAALGLAILLLPPSASRLAAQDARPAGKGKAMSKRARPDRPPAQLRGKSPSDWLAALKDSDPAVRTRALEVLATLDPEQAGDQWSNLQIEINAVALADKDRGVSQAAAKVADLFKIRDAEMRRRIAEESTRAIPPTSTPLRLVDARGEPVAGAVVSTYFERDHDTEPSFAPHPAIGSRSSDARGEAALDLEIPGHLDGAGVYAIRQEPGQDRPLVGVSKVARDQVGKPLTITMSPACRVRFRVDCPGLAQVAEKYNVDLSDSDLWRAAYLALGDDHRAPRPVFTHSNNGELEFFLPPGRYTLYVYGTDVEGVRKPVEIEEGHRVRSLGVVELAPGESIRKGVFRGYHHWFLADRAGGQARVTLRQVRGVGLKGRVRGTQAVAYSPDGTLLATAHRYNADPGEVKLWDARSGKLVAELPVPATAGGVSEVVFSPDGTLLAGSVGSAPDAEPPGVIALWDVAARRILRTLSDRSGRFTALAFSPDGETLASGGQDRSVRLWDVADGRETAKTEGNPARVGALAFTADGKGLVIGTGQSLRLWDVAGNRLRATLESEGFIIRAVALSPDGRTLAAAGSTTGPGGAARRGQVRLYDLSRDPPGRRAELIFESERPDHLDRRDSPFGDVAFTPDGRRVVAVAMGTVVTWDTATGALRDFFDRDAASSEDRLAVSPDGRGLALSGMFGTGVIDITPPGAP